jgi:cyclopropane fatty-acyl-phospholipid synthase-like methyltransferase
VGTALRGWVGALNWQEVWERKGSATDIPDDEIQKLAALMKINAWDNELVGVGLETMRDTANSIRDLMTICPQDTLLDIGCGCGLVYYAMQGAPEKLHGVDYSASAIEVARKILPGNFYCCAAGEFVPEPGFFDKAISIGVFMYFPDLDYALAVVKKMVDALKPGGSGLIMSIPDLAYKEQREALRRGRMPLEEFEERYKGLEHLYFSKAWFLESLASLGCESEFVEIFSGDYAYNHHQYHLKFRKQGSSGYLA